MYARYNYPPNSLKIAFCVLEKPLGRNLEIFHGGHHRDIDHICCFKHGWNPCRINGRCILTRVQKTFCTLWWNPWGDFRKLLWDTPLSFLTYIPRLVISPNWFRFEGVKAEKPSAACQSDCNKVSPWRDVTLLARRMLPPGELRCICECYRRQLQTTTDTSDRY